MPRELFTIGYEGTDIDTFIANLKRHAIDCLLDVRELPISRKRGFSKSALAERLESEDITYVHLKELGAPKAVREELKLRRDYRVYFRKIENYLAGNKGYVDKAYAYVKKDRCCLMCFELIAATCHRKVVAKKIKELDGNGLRVRNI